MPQTWTQFVSLNWTKWLLSLCVRRRQDVRYVMTWDEVNLIPGHHIPTWQAWQAGIRNKVLKIILFFVEHLTGLHHWQIKPSTTKTCEGAQNNGRWLSAVLRNFLQSFTLIKIVFSAFAKPALLKSTSGFTNKPFITQWKKIKIYLQKGGPKPS